MKKSINILKTKVNYIKNKTYNLYVCECTNGLYLGYNGNITEYYARMAKELNCEYAQQFVYTTDNKLTVGFNKKPLIQGEKLCMEQL